MPIQIASFWFPVQGVTLWRNIASIVEDFKPSIPPNSTVQAVTSQLWTHFNELYQQHIAQNPAAAVQSGQAALNFVVAGYDPGSRVASLFSFDIPSQTAPTSPSRTSNNPGPWWIGQADVIARIVNGYDPRMLTLPPVQAAHQAGTAITQLSGLSYIIPWNTVTLQDAIDFAVSMIQMTATIQKFTAGTVLHPGSVAGVGGPIDVAVVEPGATVDWIRRKELHT
jgi:hypothetical protein